MRKFLFLFVSCVLSLNLLATTLQVEQLSKSDLKLAVEIIGRIEFKGTTLNFYDRQGKLIYTTDMTSVQAINLTDDEELGEGLFQSESGKYSIYPNPAQSVIVIEGLEDAVTIRLFGLDGQLIKSDRNTQLDVQDVPVGNYLLQFNNQIVKIIKK